MSAMPWKIVNLSPIAFLVEYIASAYKARLLKKKQPVVPVALCVIVVVIIIGRLTETSCPISIKDTLVGM